MSTQTDPNLTKGHAAYNNAADNNTAKNSAMINNIVENNSAENNTAVNNTIRPHAYFVIPVFNRRDLTRDCLTCLSNQTDRNFTVIVVDDGSTDGTSEMIASEFPHAVVLRGNGNLWWTGATRQGTEYAVAQSSPGDYVVLLNDDLLLEPDFVQRLIDTALENPDTLIGSVVLDVNQRDVIQNGGTYVNWFTAQWRKINEGKLLSSFPEKYQLEVSTLTGRGVLIPVKVFQEIGHHNNNHFPQHGDTELPVRAHHAGYRLIVHYDSKVYCHFDLENDVNAVKRYKLSDIRGIFTDQRSYLNLRERFWFAVDTRMNTLQGGVFYLFDMMRILKHVLVRLELST